MIDSASMRALKGGAHTGPNPTDRGKNGCKRHVVTDADGLPLATIHLDRATPRHHNWVATLGWTFTRGPEGQPTSWISAP